MHSLRALLIGGLIIFSFCALSVVQAQQPAPASSAAAPAGSAPSKFRLLRSVSGTKALQQGSSYVVEDPRTLFYLPDDKQIVVHFTWEGPTGLHNFEGWWKNPEGKVTATSNFSFTAEHPRFGSYFSLTTNESLATGVWTLEVRVDGEPAGTHSFQIVTGTRPASATIRRALTRAEVYQLIAGATVSIENLNRNDERQKFGSGFFLGPNRLVTSFEVIDSASRLRITLPDGNRIEVQDVITWHRRKDWAILKVSSGNFNVLKRSSEPASVGDRIFSLDVPTEGNRVLQETTLIGQQVVQGGGERVIVADQLGKRAIGAPVLNDYGEVVGLIGGGLIPGASFLEGGIYPGPLSSMGNSLRGSLAVPISLVTEPPEETAATTIQQLSGSGQFSPALFGQRNIMGGILARGVQKKSDMPLAIDERSEFTKRDTEAALIINWYPKEKRKGLPALHLYDLDNRLLAESKQKKSITLNPNKFLYTTWQFSLVGLPPGIYRIDVLLDSDAVWRTFFRIVD